MKPDQQLCSPDQMVKATTLGPSGEILSRNDLPSPRTRRWVSRRKAEVVAGVRAGLITLDEALETYNLSIDEYHSWERLFTEYGLEGLRTTRIKKYRDRERRIDTVKRNNSKALAS